MERPELVLEGITYINGGLERVAIGIDEGCIVAIKKTLSGERHRNYGDKLLLPGAIDTHVHFREPGQTHKEDFGTGTMAAAFGGVTTVVDMPNNIPPVENASSYRDKLSLVKRKANVDFGLFPALVPMSESDLEFLIRNSPGFKLYMGPTTGNLYRDEESMMEGLAALARVCENEGLTTRITAHCEDPTTIKQRTEGREEQIKTLEDHNHIRDTGSEAMRTARFLDLTGYNSRRGLFTLNVAHVSSPGTVKIISRKEEELGIEIFSEITPHHIFLNQRYRHPFHDSRAFGKVNPPLRDIDTQRRMWEAVARGDVKILATDHAPHTIEEKSEEFYRAPAGLPGVETSLPLMLYLLRTQNIALQTLIEMTAQNPARYLGLERKGSIAVGKDADIVVVDLRDVTRIKGDDLHSKCGWTPYEGMNAIFPLDVYLRGYLVIKDRAVEEEKKGVELFGED